MATLAHLLLACQEGAEGPAYSHEELKFGSKMRRSCCAASVVSKEAVAGF